MNLVLVLSGALCLLLGGALLFKTVPRAGKPDSVWTSSDTRVITVVMSVLILLFAGIVLLLKGVFPG
jgi:hypothetical protein